MVGKRVGLYQVYIFKNPTRDIENNITKSQGPSIHSSPKLSGFVFLESGAVGLCLRYRGEMAHDTTSVKESNEGGVTMIGCVK